MIGTIAVVAFVADVVATDAAVAGSVGGSVIAALAVRGELAMIAAGGSDGCGSKSWLWLVNLSVVNQTLFCRRLCS